MKITIGHLRILAIVEGVSLLTLLFIAMPLKYQFGLPEVVTMVGWIHGLLFMGFVFVAMSVAQKKDWSEGFTFLLVLSSMVPFGMVFMDKRIRAKAIS
jgi:integral membrane protein